MSFICDLLCNVIEQLGPSNIFSVVMDGACKGAFPLIRGKYPHIQCFTCPAHGLDGFIKNICGSKEEIQMQRNEMGGVGVQHGLPTKAPDCPYSRSLPGSCTRSLVSCAQRLHVSTVGLSRDGFT